MAPAPQSKNKKASQHVPVPAPKLIAEDSQSEETPGLPFPVVGVGASAGGLEAFIALLQNLPADTGMAFVLVQHLSPSHKSMLADILEKKSAMPVIEVTDDLQVVPNRVYVIPPNACMCILDGHLRLKERGDTGEQNLPIDVFLTSLAEHQKSRAIAIILSGSASDGSQGIRVIKDHGGITFAQDEKTAQFVMMPRNAAATGYIDYVLAPNEIAAELVNLSRHPYMHSEAKADELISEESSFHQILMLLQKSSGIDFRSYKSSTLKRRILRRMMLIKKENVKDYISYLIHQPKELETLSQDIFITVTRFFRDPSVFEALKDDVFPHIAKDPSETIRIWALGCSTGEEVYSIAISLLEYLNGRGNYRLQFFATDIKDPSLEHARQGIYPDTITADVSQERLAKFFLKVPKGYQIIKSIRDMCVFARHNVVSDPPFSKIDLVSCRNLLIYLDANAQKRVIPLFHYALNPSGFLLLGQAESVGAFNELFNAVNKKAKIYSKNTSQRTPQLLLARGRMPHSDPTAISRALMQPPARITSSDIQKEADRVVLKRQHHSAVVINEAMEVIQFRGDTSRYLKHVPGMASLSLLKMVQESLYLALRNAMQKVQEDNASLKTKTIRIKDGGTHIDVVLEIIPFTVQSQRDRYFLIVFEEPKVSFLPQLGMKKTKARKVSDNQARVDALEQELESTTQHLQGTIDAKEAANEELQAANEEILSANEELQSLNEEFQSANEELESAKEELQATNEEISTLNDELQKRNADLSELDDQHNNLMNSVDIAVIMVGRDLKIRSYTPAAERVLRLSSSDIGRFLRDLNLDLKLADIDMIILHVINTGVLSEHEACDRKGCWYKIQIRPYKTGDNFTTGAVVTFLDITALKQSQEQVRAFAAYREAIVQTIHNPLIVLDSRLRIKFANHSFYTSFNQSPDNTLDQFIYDLENGEWNIPALKTLCEEIIPKHKVIHDYVVQHECPGTGHPRTLMINARKIRSEDRKEELILLTIEDITARKQAEEQLRVFTEELKRSNNDLEQFAQIASHDIQEPLKIVNNYVQLLQKKIRPDEDPSSKNFIDIIGKEIGYIQSLVKGLLAYSKIDSSDKVFEEVDCNACVENALMILQILIHESGAKVTSGGLPRISGDQVQITRLFQNLISNAIKFRKPDVTPQIQVMCEEREHAYEISVLDNGIGIAPEHFEKIFGIFSRVDKSYPGSGIGLSEVKKIVERHGGKIGVKSALGQGTTFVITFPR